MKKSLLVLLVTILIITLLLFAAACGGKSKESVFNEENQTEELNFDVAVTVGNSTYVPLNIGGKVSAHVQEILQVVDGFERAHPELEVKSWILEKKQRAYWTDPYIYGIWFYHHPVQ